MCVFKADLKPERLDEDCKSVGSEFQRLTVVLFMVYSTQANSMLIGPFQKKIEWTNQHRVLRN